MAYSESDKLQHEVEKLIEEVKTLKRPYILQPSAWFAAFGLLISIIVNFSQCSDVKGAKILADIQMAQSKLDADRISRSNESLKKTGDSLKQMKSLLTDDNAALQETFMAGKKQLDSLQIKIIETQTILSTILDGSSYVSSNTAKLVKELKQSLDGLSNINISTTKSFIKNSTLNLELAETKEKEGFQNFLNGNYDYAAQAFIESENAYNEYHTVYELAQLMIKYKQELTDNPNKKKDLIQRILNNYSYGLSQDIIDQLKTQLNK